MATREEAPSVSGYLTVYWPLMGRDVHVLSAPEFKVVLIVLHCPWVFELQEQRLIHFDERPHPLTDHPRAHLSRPAPLPGACMLAEKLGLLKHYPTIKTKVAGQRYEVPSFLIGDLLPFIAGSQGPYCVHLNIKDTSDAFQNPPDFKLSRMSPEDAREQEISRHRIVRERYRAGGIKTVDIAADEDVDSEVCNNLRAALLYQKRRFALSRTAYADLMEEFRLGISKGQCALEVVRRVSASSSSLDVDELKTAFYRAIWSRDLRLDLFHPVLFDQPMQLETRDVFEVYANWFTRD
ncbi:PDDEXK family nuclease [Variovorax paradoxus]|uniref:hypothetical protein n=1 Tax=Variovorax paradoxus TaxID=34073 RepID=UPI0029C671FA|nr:hypothetical protein RZE77_20495 [Variovorax paradoxus]